MHVRELTEFGAMLTMHGPLLIQQGEQIPERSLEGYWASSKCRHERWQRAIKSYEVQSKALARTHHESLWLAVKPTLEEILVSELLTRVWTAVVCAVDRKRGKQEAEPIVRNVLTGHLEARNRALNLLVYGPSISIEEAVSLNRLRRRVERWTDMLIGHLVVHQDVREFAFEPARAAEFARDLREEVLAPSGPGWPLTLTSLRVAFHGLGKSSHANDDVNGGIASSILLSFRPDVFDSTGLFRSLWLERLSLAANDSEGMIEELLSLEKNGPSAPASASPKKLSLEELFKRRWN